MLSKIYACTLLLLIFVSCNEPTSMMQQELQPEEEITIIVTAQDLEIEIDENPINGSVLGTIDAETNNGDLSFTLASESVIGALEISQSTGEITVLDASLFEFDDNPIITAVVDVINGEASQSVNVEISLLEVLPEAVVYTGPKITFEKANFADISQAENQDRITGKVWLTRAQIQGLFNINQEAEYVTTSPADTEWAAGTTANLDNLSFTTWKTAIDSDPGAALNQDFVLHLISDNIYIDIKFLSWSVGRSEGGGGFSYERSTPPE